MAVRDAPRCPLPRFVSLLGAVGPMATVRGVAGAHEPPDVDGPGLDWGGMFITARLIWKGGGG